MKTLKTLLIVAALIAMPGVLAACNQGSSGAGGSDGGGARDAAGVDSGPVTGDTTPGNMMGAPATGSAGGETAGNPGGGTATGGAGGPEISGNDAGGTAPGGMPERPANLGTDTENTPGATGGMPGSAISSSEVDGNTAQPQTH